MFNIFRGSFSFGFSSYVQGTSLAISKHIEKFEKNALAKSALPSFNPDNISELIDYPKLKSLGVDQITLASLFKGEKSPQDHRFQLIKESLCNVCVSAFLKENLEEVKIISFYNNGAVSILLVFGFS
jgi:hypothetical protein